ncbi:DUF4959 domain-containing protein [Sphingobacterium corticibacterium]|uniref:DUF4959 domain-containing protein n=1 Tax=Sphingobacterium corticibacterium TaxID=2484746 RepID=A0A4Q6XXX0_9SPHI|nr:DUF4959 domain-containing protein [Sphingobacterium corticibacterium]RZF61637.1 DUF4959 domain-containing protein [Sphingobacterium corticibacterium]
MKKITKNFQWIYFFIVVFAVFSACDEPLEFRETLGEDGSVPGQVSNVKVENLPGKAKITYTLPNNRNLLYVQAEYTMGNGEKGVAQASYYQDTLEVVGFANTEEHEVKLYTISRAQVKSEPVIVTVKPLDPPFKTVFESIQVANAFGGYNLAALNEAQDNIGVMVMFKNDFGEFEVNNTRSIFTKSKSIDSRIRGMEAKPTDLQIYVRDNWGNSSDTMRIHIEPIFEQEIPKSDFRPFVLPGDAPQVTNGARLEYAWDNQLGWPNTSFTNQTTGGSDPHIVTFDMGIEAKLSRVWIRPFPEGTRFYFLSTMKRFEIWGSTNPNLNGALDDSWRLLGSYEVIKPSNLPYGTDSAEDQATAAAGFNWEVDLEAPKVRYIRIRCLENFAGGTAQNINELSIFGTLE